MVLTVYLVLTPERPGLFVSVVPRFVTARLGTCRWGAGPARFGRPPMRRLSSKRIRVHRIPPRVRDDAYAPLQSRRDGATIIMIFQKKRKRIIFRGAA
jgi:hypothetical protein